MARRAWAVQFLEPPPKRDAGLASKAPQVSAAQRLRETAAAADAAAHAEEKEQKVVWKHHRLVMRKPAAESFRVVDFSEVPNFERDRLLQPFKMIRKGEVKDEAPKPGRRKKKQRVVAEELTLVDSLKSKYDGVEKLSRTAEGAQAKKSRLFVVQSEDKDVFSLIPVGKWYEFHKPRNVIRRTDEEIEAKFDLAYKVPDKPSFLIRKEETLETLSRFADGPREPGASKKKDSGDAEDDEMDEGGDGAGGGGGGEKRKKFALRVDADNEDMVEYDEANKELDQDAADSDEFESDLSESDTREEERQSDEAGSDDEEEKDEQDDDDDDEEEFDPDEPEGGASKPKVKKEQKESGEAEAPLVHVSITKKRKAEQAAAEIAEEIQNKKSRATGAVSAERKEEIRQNIIKYLNRKEMSRPELATNLAKLYKKARTELERKEMQDHADVVVLEVAYAEINPYDGKPLLRLKAEYKLKK